MSSSVKSAAFVPDATQRRVSVAGKNEEKSEITIDETVNDDEFMKVTRTSSILTVIVSG